MGLTCRKPASPRGFWTKFRRSCWKILDGQPSRGQLCHTRLVITATKMKTSQLRHILRRAPARSRSDGRDFLPTTPLKTSRNFSLREERNSLGLKSTFPNLLAKKD